MDFDNYIDEVVKNLLPAMRSSSSNSRASASSQQQDSQQQQQLVQSNGSSSVAAPSAYPNSIGQVIFKKQIEMSKKIMKDPTIGPKIKEICSDVLKEFIREVHAETIEQEHNESAYPLSIQAVGGIDFLQPQLPAASSTSRPILPSPSSSVSASSSLFRRAKNRLLIDSLEDDTALSSDDDEEHGILRGAKGKQPVASIAETLSSLNSSKHEESDDLFDTLSLDEYLDEDFDEEVEHENELSQRNSMLEESSASVSIPEVLPVPSSHIPSTIPNEDPHLLMESIVQQHQAEEQRRKAELEARNSAKQEAVANNEHAGFLANLLQRFKSIISFVTTLFGASEDQSTKKGSYEPPITSSNSACYQEAYQASSATDDLVETLLAGALFLVSGFVFYAVVKRFSPTLGKAFVSAISTFFLNKKRTMLRSKEVA